MFMSAPGILLFRLKPCLEDQLQADNFLSLIAKTCKLERIKAKTIPSQPSISVHVVSYRATAGYWGLDNLAVNGYRRGL